MSFNRHGRPLYGKRLAVGLVLGSVVAVGGGSTRAASEEFCRQYTADAVADQGRNLDMKCGFSGPPWSANRAGHHPWCLGAREDSANQQRNDRRSWLDRCQRCNGYADRALAAINKAARLCNFNDARWDPNRGGHFKWCMEAKDEHVNREDTFRTFDADKCVRCTNYAEEARRAQEDNRARGCGFTGPEWNPNRGAHFDWCWNLSPSYLGATTEQTANRSRMLANCPDAAKRQRCENYADRAISQYYAMRKLANCNQTGVKWHDNRANHYNWCIAVSADEMAAHDRERDAKLAECGRSQSAPPPSGEQCLFSAIVRNKSCINVDRSPMTSRPDGSLSATGCGDTQDKAVARAQASMASYQCLTPGDTPAPGCCTFASTVSQGCLCGIGTRGLPVQPMRPHSNVLRNEPGVLNQIKRLPQP